MKEVKEKLLAIQGELKAPKSNFNSFGNYNYRNCEDILEAVKPLCLQHHCLLTIQDELLQIGNRYYVKSSATIMDIETEDTLSAISYAREAKEKKGMDESQITGAAISYARKYALNGLFCIDDTRDVDEDIQSKTKETPTSTPRKKEMPSEMTEEQKNLWNLLMEICGTEKESAVNAELKKRTSFVLKKGDNIGKTVEGKDNILLVSDMQAKVVRKQIEKEKGEFADAY